MAGRLLIPNAELTIGEHEKEISLHVDYDIDYADPSVGHFGDVVEITAVHVTEFQGVRREHMTPGNAESLDRLLNRMTADGEFYGVVLEAVADRRTMI